MTISESFPKTTILPCKLQPDQRWKRGGITGNLSSSLLKKLAYIDSYKLRARFQEAGAATLIYSAAIVETPMREQVTSPGSMKATRAASSCYISIQSNSSSEQDPAKLSAYQQSGVWKIWSPIKTRRLRPMAHQCIDWRARRSGNGGKSPNFSSGDPNPLPAKTVPSGYSYCFCSNFPFLRFL